MCVPGARRFVRPTPFQLLAIVVVKLRHVCTTKPQQIRTDRTSRGLFRNKRIGKLALALTTLCSFSLAHSLTHMHARTHTLPCYGSQSQKWQRQERLWYGREAGVRADGLKSHRESDPGQSERQAGEVRWSEHNVKDALRQLAGWEPVPVTPELKTGQEGKGKRGSEARSNGLKLREAWADPKSETGRKRIAPTHRAGRETANSLPDGAEREKNNNPVSRKAQVAGGSATARQRSWLASLPVCLCAKL